MTTVKNILQVKGSRVLSVTPQTSVFDALRIMAENNIGALLVMEGTSLAGFFSERDYARNMVRHDKLSNDIPVKDFMSTHVISIKPDQSIQECMTLMTERRVRHLPVLDGDKVIGLISIGDVVKAIINDQQYMIDQLENYITGKR